jgi:hypothetical protein
MPGISDILKAHPATPKDLNAGLTIALTSQETTQLSDPTSGLAQGGRGGGKPSGAVMADIESLPFVGCQSDLTAEIGGKPGLISEP